MKFAALLASAFVATAVQAAQVNLHYCQGPSCTDELVEADQCTDLKHPGYLTSIANTADCELFPYPGCRGDDQFVPRGTNLLRGAPVRSVLCFEPGLSRNPAPAVQASADVTVYYCLENGQCTEASVEPYECNDLEEPGYLHSIQNTANCRLFEYPGCGGRVKPIARGAHAGDELRNIMVGSFDCSEPGLPRNLAPAVQASADVMVYYCLENGQCTQASVEPYECNDLEVPGFLRSIQNIADCKLFEFPGCGGRVKWIARGAHAGDELRNIMVGSFECMGPTFQRNQHPMRRH